MADLRIRSNPGAEIVGDLRKYGDQQQINSRPNWRSWYSTMRLNSRDRTETGSQLEVGAVRVSLERGSCVMVRIP